MSLPSTRARMRMALATALALCLPGAAWAQAERLLHDPFARPALSELRKPQPLLVPGTEQAAALAPAPAPWNPELTAVMVAGRQSIANLDGEMVGIGEKIHGYVLVEVREDEVVLVKDKKRLVVPMRGR